MIVNPLIIKFLFTVVVVLTGLLQVLAQASQPGIPLIDQYTPLAYDGGPEIWDISQDSRGIMYFANNYAMYDFDGTYWGRHPVGHKTVVRKIHIESEGRIYIGAENDFGYFELSGTLQPRYVSLIDSLDSEKVDFESVWNIFCEKDEVYFYNPRSVIVFNKNRKTLEVVSLPKHHRKGLWFQHSVLISVEGKGPCLMKQGSFDLIKGGGVLKDVPIVNVLPFGQKEHLFITESKGIMTYDGMNFKPWQTQVDSWLPELQISTAVKLQNDLYALGTMNDGIIILNGNGQVMHHLNYATGLLTNIIISLFEDREGNLWVGHNNGISCIHLNSPFSLINSQLGLDGSGFGAQSTPEGLVLGTYNGAYILKEQTNQHGFGHTQVKKIEGVRGKVYDIFSLGGKVLITTDQGLFDIHDLSSGSRIGQVKTWKPFVPAKSERMIVGTVAGFELLEYNKDQWKHLGRVHGFNESSRVFEEDSDGVIWMTHGHKGVFKLQFSAGYDSIVNFRFYGKRDGLPSSFHINVFKHGNEPIFSTEYGIYKYDKHRDIFEKHPLFDLIFSDSTHVLEMESNTDGSTYYLATVLKNNGDYLDLIGELKMDRFGKISNIEKTFRSINHLVNKSGFSHINILDNQHLTIGANEGFVYHNTGFKSKSFDSLNTVIRQVSLQRDGKDTMIHSLQKPIPDEQLFSYEYGPSSMRFSYSSPYYTTADRTLYQYRLKGFDDRWSQWSLTSFKEFNNLYEGDYEFGVRAQNVHGEVSGVATYSFKVLPPWYRTPLAFIVYVALAMMPMALLVIRYRRKFTRVTEKMTMDQRIELDKKDREIDEANKKSEQEIVKLRNEKLRTEIELKNRELANTTMHVLNKNDLFLRVRRELKSLSAAVEQKSNETKLRRLIRQIDQNLRDDKDWEKFNFHFTEVHGDFTDRLKSSYPDLSPQDLKTCAYLRMNLTTKDIAQLLSISVRGVEQGRYRLRKKLRLNGSANLTDFILNF